MSGPAIHDVVLTRPGETSPVTLHATGVVAAWDLRPPGTASVEVVTADLIDAFNTTDLRHKYWLFWEHPTAGPWAGVVTATEDASDTGTTEIACRDFSELLAARITAKVYDLPAINPGGAARKIIFDAGRSYPTWIAGFELDTLLPAIPFQSRADQVLAAVERLASESGGDWQVTDQRVLRFLGRIGRDVSATRQLVYGRQILSYRFSQIGDPVRNELVAIPADDTFVRTTSVVVSDDASRREVGLRQDSVVFDGMTTETQLKPAALAELARRVKLGRALTLVLQENPAFDGPDPCFGWAKEGDTISVLLPPSNFAGNVRVLVRTFDSETDLMTVTAEVA